MRALERWLFRPAPPTRLAMLRILIGAYAFVFLVARVPYLWDASRLPRRQFEPVGVLAWMDSPWPAAFVRGLVVVSIPLAAAFVLGWRYRVVGPLFAVVLLVVVTYRMSWGHVIHTEHLMVLHVLVLGFTAAAGAWSLDARRAGVTVPSGAAGIDPDPYSATAWPVQVMALITVVAYVLAGVAKLRNGGNDWLVGDVLRNQVAYDNLRKELLGSWHSPLGGWSVRYGWLFPPMAIATAVVEIGAPVALISRRWAWPWAVAAWTFHAGIVALMWITFPYPLVFLAYAPFFAVERLGERVLARRNLTNSSSQRRQAAVANSSSRGGGRDE